MESQKEQAIGVGWTAIVIGAILVYTGTTLWGIAAIAIGAIILYGARSMGNDDEEEGQTDIVTATGEIVDSGNDDDLTFPIKGLFYRDLEDKYIGESDGYVRALVSNEHDSYAIGVFVGPRRVGFLPRGNYELHTYLMENGGRADAKVSIRRGIDDKGRDSLFGQVTVLL